MVFLTRREGIRAKLWQESIGPKSRERRERWHQWDWEAPKKEGKDPEI